MPGLIDPHTHLIFAGSREREFEQRIQGLSPYLRLLKGEGGSFQQSRRPEKGLFRRTLSSLERRGLTGCFPKGVTTVEAKSGYGLSLPG